MRVLLVEFEGELAQLVLPLWNIFFAKSSGKECREQWTLMSVFLPRRPAIPQLCPRQLLNTPTQIDKAKHYALYIQNDRTGGNLGRQL